MKSKLVILYIISLVIIGTYVPYYEVTAGQYSDAGYYFLADPPRAEGLAAIITKYEVNTEKIIFEAIIATGSFALLMFMFGRGKKRKKRR